MSDVPQAIPTTYTCRDGSTVHLKSRLEGFVAWLLDQLGLTWQYEPESFMLADGTNYIPDFWLPGPRAWIEVRGYDTPKGRRQIMGFSEHLAGGAPWCSYDESRRKSVSQAYLVLTQNAVLWKSHVHNMLHGGDWAEISWCPTCQSLALTLPDSAIFLNTLCSCRFGRSSASRRTALLITTWSGRIGVYDQHTGSEYFEPSEELAESLAEARRRSVDQGG